MSKTYKQQAREALAEVASLKAKEERITSALRVMAEFHPETAKHVAALFAPIYGEFRRADGSTFVMRVG